MELPTILDMLTIATSAESTAVPPLPVLSVLFDGFGSGWAAVAVAVLSKAPAALIVAVTLIVVFAPEASEAIVHGSDEQPHATVPPGAVLALSPYQGAPPPRDDRKIPLSGVRANEHASGRMSLWRYRPTG